MIWSTETIDGIEVNIIVKSEVCADNDEDEAAKENLIYLSAKPISILDCS